MFVTKGEVDWVLGQRESSETRDAADCATAPRVVLDWGGDTGPCDYVPSELLQKRLGAEFERLYVSSTGLHVYLNKQLILTAGSIYRTDTEVDLLYLSEEE